MSSDAKTSESESKPELWMGTCLGGPCDGQRFQVMSNQKRVRIRDRETPPNLHIYAYHPEQSAEHGKPIFLHEKLEAWKFGG